MSGLPVFRSSKKLGNRMASHQDVNLKNQIATVREGFWSLLGIPPAHFGLPLSVWASP